MEEIKEPSEDEVSFYGYYYDNESSYNEGYYEESDGEGYDWNDRDNPCKAYYYTQYNRTIQNI